MESTKTALITGITGQDGAYLSKLLIEKGYRVIGLTRYQSLANKARLTYLGIADKVIMEECNLLDVSQIIKLLMQYQPEEIYNLAAQSSVSASFRQPIETINFNSISVINLLESIKIVNKKIKFYQASSSEMFGDINQLPIVEDSIFHPKSPYAISKATAHWICVNYRESYDLFISCGILFNHESYLRSENFFMKKILRTAINISKGKQDKLVVGNIDIKRDFGYAPAYIETMYLMLQHHTPKNYIVCSGKSVSLRSIIEYIFLKLDIPLSKLELDKDLYRPSEIPDIYGSPDLVKNELGWQYDMTVYEVIDLLLAEELTALNLRAND
ncbi:MAG: GDP-mannose 4,6-dehydratase [Saprospiraceae bacterium]|nr:GDP-mannose 4,6-dehydratase [Saprospiraceae bacterium]